MSPPGSDVRRPPEAPPGLPARLVHPADGDRVRALLAAAGTALVPRLRCDACRRTLRPADVRPATTAEADRWYPAVAGPRFTGYL